jgi:hypothetical protein
VPSGNGSPMRQSMTVLGLDHPSARRSMWRIAHRPSSAIG